MNQLKDTNETIYKLIGACMEVHKTLGPGFEVETYKKALEIEFKGKEFDFEAEKTVEVVYKENLIATMTVDFIINGSAILAIRCQNEIKDTEIQQVLRALPLTNTNVGLLVNFGGTKIQYKRILPSRQGRNDMRKDQFIGVAAYREMGRTREANPII